MRKATGSYCTYSIPGKTAALVPEFAVGNLPSAKLQPKFLHLQWMTCPWAENTDDLMNSIMWCEESAKWKYENTTNSLLQSTNNILLMQVGRSVNILLITLQNIMHYLFFRPYFIMNNKDMTYRYLFEIIIADNTCEQKYARCTHIKNLRCTFTWFTKVELSIQVLSYFTSIVILNILYIRGHIDAEQAPLI